jgi:hypothetical protein
VVRGVKMKNKCKKYKIVYSASYGGFGLSDEAKDLYKELSGSDYRSDIKRYDTFLVEVVEQLKEKA